MARRRRLQPPHVSHQFHSESCHRFLRTQFRGECRHVFVRVQEVHECRGHGGEECGGGVRGRHGEDAGTHGLAAGDARGAGQEAVRHAAWHDEDGFVWDAADPECGAVGGHALCGGEHGGGCNFAYGLVTRACRSSVAVHSTTGVVVVVW
jgi:hypothetical protein